MNLFTAMPTPDSKFSAISQISQIFVFYTSWLFHHEISGKNSCYRYYLYLHLTHIYETTILFRRSTKNRYKEYSKITQTNSAHTFTNISQCSINPSRLLRLRDYETLAVNTQKEKSLVGENLCRSAADQ